MITSAAGDGSSKSPLSMFSTALAACLVAAAIVHGQSEVLETGRISGPFHPANASNNPGLSGLDVDGNTFVVGANLMAHGQGSAVLSAVGAALVYTRSPQTGAWSFQAELRPSDPQPNQFFGSNITLDGDRVAVGAIGAVYAFERANGSWRQTGRFPRSGVARAASLDGDLLAIGDWSVVVQGRSNAGRVSLYRFRSGVWSHEADLFDPSPDAEDSFGRHVSTSGDRVLVYSANHSGGLSNPVAHVFHRGTGGPWQHEAALQPDWGSSTVPHFFRLTSASLAGDVVLIQGGPRAAILERRPSGWVQTQVIDKRVWGFASNDYHQDLRGDAFVVSSGQRVHDGAGFVSLVFRRVAGEWIKQATLTQAAGYGLALPHIDGDRVVTVRGDVDLPCALGASPSCGKGVIHTYDLLDVPESYGVGCSGATIPTLAVAAIPDLGASRDLVGGPGIEFSVDNAVPGSVGFLLVGAGRISLPLGGGCDMQLHPIPDAIGPLWMSGSNGAPAGSGNFRLPLSLPPRLLGTFSVQALVVDPASRNGWFTVTAPIEISFP